MRNHIILSTLLFAVAACGGAQKTGGAHGVPPPPQIADTQPASGGNTAAPAPEHHEVSTDAKKDYQAAYAFFQENDDKHSWNDSACRDAADKFESVARAHGDLVEAEFMVGLSYERCGMYKDAERAYTAASQMKGNPEKIAMAVSSLGSLYYREGKVDGARQYWTTALNATGKLVGANIGMATLDLEQMRKINNPRDASWQQLEKDARFKLSSALGVDTDSVEAYTAYGLVWMEGWKYNKNRLDLAKTMLDEGKKRDEKYAPLQNAYGLYYLHKGQLNQALQSFQAAVEADPKFVEAHVNAGLINLGFRKYDTAKDLLSKAVELQPSNYDAVIGLGFAERGLGDFDGAEAMYKKAIQIDPRQGDAYYNLGVLYKAFRAPKADISTSIKMYATAKDYFEQFLDKEGDAGDKVEAKNNIADCDKVVKQLEDFQRAQANMPQQPATPPAPATPAAGAGGGSGSAPAGGTPPAKP